MTRPNCWILFRLARLRQPREVQAQTLYDSLLLPYLVYEAGIPGTLEKRRSAPVEATGQRLQGKHPLAPPIGILGTLDCGQSLPSK